MPRHNEKSLARSIEEAAREKSPLEQIRLRLVLAGDGTIAAWGREHGFTSEEISMTLSGHRPYPRIRQAIAETAGVPREQVDRIIDEAKRERDAAREAASAA